MSRLARLIAVIALLAAAAASSATARERLVLDEGRAPGWHHVAFSSSNAGRLFGVALPARTTIDAAGARTRGLTLRSVAFSLRTASAASRLDIRWSRLHHARPFRLGAGGRWSVTRVGRHAERVAIVWRRGSRLGLLVLDLQGRPKNPGALGLGWGRLADTYLRSVFPRDAWARVLAEIRPNGSFSAATAMQAFQVSYGRARGPRPRSLFSGSLAFAMVMRYLHRLNPAQRRVVERRLGVHPKRPRRGRAAVTSKPDYGDAQFTYDGVYTALARHWASLFTAKLRHPLRLKIIAGRSPEVTPPTQMDAGPVADASGAEWNGGPGFCRIRLGPAALDVSPLDRGWILAHEVFHCFEMDIAQANWVYIPPWLLEGMAEWAALAIDPVATEQSIAWINTYIDTPAIPLFQRTYDAVGFFGHAQDATANLWLRVEPTILAPNEDAAFTAAGGRLESFLATWGSSLFRMMSLGLPWEMLSPIVPLGFNLKAPGGLGTVPGRAQAAPLTTSQYVLDTRAAPPLIHFSIPGHARLEWHRSQYTDLRDTWFCSDTAGTEGCRCPPDTVGTTPPSVPIGAGAILGVTGDPAGNYGQVTAHQIDEFCHPRPVPHPPGGGSHGHGGLGCGSQCGSSSGDPHLETFDGYDYDFQAAGEFTAVKSTRGDLEIQERQEPYGSLNVTVNTAVAMRVAGARVEVDKGAPLRVLINGARVTVGPVARSLPGGGTVADVGNQIIVTWPDGTQAQLWSVGPWGVAYLVEPAADRAGRLVGLLGAFDGDARHLTGRDGHVYVASALEGRRGAALKYRRFGASWRITRATSLFSYGPGKSTGSYTDRRVPERIITPGTLSPRVRAAAQRTCRGSGITRPLILRNCVLDVAMTGQSRFASSSATLQRTVDAHAKPVPPPPPGGGTERFQTTCYSDGTAVPAGTVNQVAPGTSAGIVANLLPSVPGARTIIQWDAPPGTIDEPTSEGDSVFADLDTPGLYTVSVTYAGDGAHSAARSATCRWNVAG